MATFTADSYVWLEDEDDCYLPAKVNSTFKAGSPGNVTIIQDGKKTKPRQLTKNETQSLMSMDKQSLSTLENMTELKQLNEASILHNLRARFKKDDIYTNIGDILVSVNPFKELPIYTPRVLERFMKKGARENSPHVYGVADNAYRSMTSFGKSQSCIVSGESGAGKTEATKLFLQYIAEVSGGMDANAPVKKKKGKKGKKGNDNSDDSSLQSQILGANPLMEAFGNAKTVRNNNSSRFGKFISVDFDYQAGGIIGASITSYLLEKSRLVFQAEGERNYHIFYQLCAASSTDPEMAEKYKIQDAAQYYYLNQSKAAATTVDGIDDSRDFEETFKAMNIMGIKTKEQQEIIAVLSGILHLGNVEFKGSDKSSIANKDMVKEAANQLGVKKEDLEKALVSRSVQAGKELVMAELKVEEAKSSRDAFCKGIYGLLFDWLIAKINSSLKSVSTSASKGTKSTIGVLDIFGFESFEVNSFEQLCINYCNEKLQGHFNEYVFSLERKMYKEEGINVDEIDFTDNGNILRVLEEKGSGILSRIDEECNIPKGSDENLLGKIHKSADDAILLTPDLKKARKDPRLNLTFGVMHYAGQVDYTITGFLDKNRDKLLADVVRLGKGSKKAFFKGLFADQSEAANKKTLGTQFKMQLKDLMGTLQKTEPHFIRCIKPNAQKEGDTFTSGMVMDQLRYAGLLEVCRIRQIGYPVRQTFDQFLKRYVPIALKENKKGKYKTAKDLCKALVELKMLNKKEYQIGKKLVFIRTAEFNSLEEKREVALREVTSKIQAIVRGFVARSKFKRFKKILDAVAKALEKEDPEKLEKALLDCGQLPYSGRTNKSVKEARTQLARLKENQQLLANLATAVKSGSISTLKGAIKACKDKKLGSKPEVKKAEKELKTLEKQSKVKESLRDAVKKKDLALLTSMLEEATQLKMEGAVEVRDASALKQRLEKEKETRKKLEAAIKKDDLEAIEKHINAMVEMGITDDPLIKKGEKAAKIKAEVTVQRTNQVAQTEKDLAEAIKARDLDRLNELEVRVIELGLESKLVDDAADLRAQLEAELEKAAKLEADVKALEIKAGSLDGLTTKDLTNLKSMMKAAKDDGVKDDNPVMKQAEELLSRGKKQIKVQATVKDAITSKDKEKKRAALKAATELGLQTEEVKELQQAVRDQNEVKEDRMKEILEAEESGDHKELKHPTKTDLQTQAMKRLARSNSDEHKKRIEKASKEFYHFTKFFQIRTDEDYTQFELPLLRKVRAETKLIYQSRRISNSILELDRDLAKVAQRNHKALLGYTGDVASNSFSTTLAQDILIRGMEIKELVDEIYIQLCKHLTKNYKKDSVDRGWLLMCMCTKQFAPSKDFELYLMNFLIEHRGVPGLVGNYARLSLFQLDATIQMEPSRFIPPLYDIKMYTKRPPILAEVHDVSGDTSNYAVTPDITVATLVGMCSIFAELKGKVSKEYGIFVKDSDFNSNYNYKSNGGGAPEKTKKRSGLALPVSAAVEAAMDMFDGATKFLGFTQRKPLPSPQSSWPLMGATFPGDVYLRMAKQGREPVFSFKRKLLFTKEQNPAVDENLYLQLLDEVLFGNLLIKNQEDRFNLVAIAMAVLHGSNFPNSEKKLLDTGLMKYVPITWRIHTSVDEWAKQVYELASKYKKEKVNKLHKMFVDICRTSPVYGMIFFSVFRQDNSTDYICGINSIGVHLLDEKLNILYTFKYGNIQKFGASARYIWLKVVAAVIKTDKDMKKVVEKNNSILQLYTLQSTEMYGLIFDHTHHGLTAK